ncbi:hypothetical protein [Microbacterium enclense]|uniref:hypothetical protein n=1 Tax=Microbacterium enclense TaxID=993073 RepID=UPI003439B24C
MTDEPTNLTEPDDGAEPTPWDEQNDPDGYTLDDISPKDWYLDTTLNFIHGFYDKNEGGVIGMTVQSGGVVVSGLAISRAAWVTETGKLYAMAGAEETGTYVEKVFRQAHNAAVEKAEERDAADLPTRARRYLHMKDVRFGVGDQWTQVPLWRGKLDDITGWSLGSWNPKQDPASDATYAD